MQHLHVDGELRVIGRYTRGLLKPCSVFFFFFSSRRRHTRCGRDWSSDVCSSDLQLVQGPADVDGAKKALRSGNPDDIGRALDELQQAYSAAGASLYAATRGASEIGRASCRERV